MQQPWVCVWLWDCPVFWYPFTHGWSCQARSWWLFSFLLKFSITKGRHMSVSDIVIMYDQGEDLVTAYWTGHNASSEPLAWWAVLSRWHCLLGWVSYPEASVCIAQADRWLVFYWWVFLLYSYLRMWPSCLYVRESIIAETPGAICQAGSILQMKHKTEVLTL